MLDPLERQKNLTSNQWKIIATANPRRHARFLRLLSDRLCAGVILKEWQLTYGRAIS